MSIVSLPTSGTSPPDGGQDDDDREVGDADGWALLEALRRRLDDQAAQGRKTQQQVSQLAESIASLVEVQRRRGRWLNLNSFIAYLIFTMLCGAGFYLLYRSRANELLEARDHADRERDAAVRRADEAAGKLAARDQADRGAWEVFQLLEAGERGDAVGKLDAVSALPLSRTERAVLAARVHETQVMEVDAALKAAAASFRAGRHAEVIAPLEAALVGEPAGTRAAAMRYYLGVAFAKTGALDKAIGHLHAALAAEVEQEDVRFQLASALDRSGAYARARAEYDRFATAHPQSPLAVFAMRRSATLARMPASAPPAAGPAGAGAAPPNVPGEGAAAAPAPARPLPPAGVGGVQAPARPPAIAPRPGVQPARPGGQLQRPAVPPARPAPLPPELKPMPGAPQQPKPAPPPATDPPPPAPASPIETELSAPSP